MLFCAVILFDALLRCEIRAPELESGRDIFALQDTACCQLCVALWV